MLKRLPTLSEGAETAAFLASDWAGAMTGTVATSTACTRWLADGWNAVVASPPFNKC
jgi:hypothetical protein